MTLTEAIKHCEDVADYDCFTDDQRKCSDEHRQLADWLRELKERREKAQLSGEDATFDCISRQAAIDAINAYLGLSAVSRTIQNMTSIQEILENLPSAESEPMCINLNEPIKVKLTDWGKTIGDGRPLADSEVIPRLQDIKRQIGGSYAIERAIEVLEELPSAESEIIRCKNCKHRDSNDCPMYYEEWIEIDEGDGYFDTDNIIHDWTTDEGFCHCAELRGEEE